jgi:uncharacterized membrane protein YgcG
MRHSCVTRASLMRRSCVTHASLMRRSCVTHASQVRALAGLEHSPYVVRYHHAWLEPQWEAMGSVLQVRVSPCTRMACMQGAHGGRGGPLGAEGTPTGTAAASGAIKPLTLNPKTLNPKTLGAMPLLTRFAMGPVLQAQQQRQAQGAKAAPAAGGGGGGGHNRGGARGRGGYEKSGDARAGGGASARPRWGIGGGWPLSAHAVTR